MYNLAHNDLNWLKNAYLVVKQDGDSDNLENLANFCKNMISLSMPVNLNKSEAREPREFNTNAIMQEYDIEPDEMKSEEFDR